MTAATDRIEKKLVLKAPQSRVWRAITNVDEFNQWFRVKLESPFQEGATVRGNITYPGYEHLTMEIVVEKIQPESYFSYRWHPGATAPSLDYSKEPTTLVEFFLEAVKEGTVLRIVESGFDNIPPARRAEAFRMNDSGWTEQMKNVERYVTQS
jgi:uncharacterized protein YndB with AHSA1/START domain